MDEYIKRADVLLLAWEGKIISTNYNKRVRDFINEIPTADVRPVVRGRWIEKSPENGDSCRRIECDQCGNGYAVAINVPFEEWKSGANKRFCGCCGADMRETEVPK